MKLLFSALSISFLVVFSSLAQEFKKLVVTDVVYVRQTNVRVTAQTFPYYFQQKGFIADVLGDIAKYSKRKFSVETVEFSIPDSVNYYSGFSPNKINLRRKARMLGGKDILYAAVETKIQQGAMVNDVQYYRFVTSLQIYTGKGRKYYVYKNIIPFETYADEDIPGDVQISDYDFYAFYLDGIQRVFEGTTKRDEHRYVPQPLADKYFDFAGNAEKFYMNFSGQSYNYGNDLKNMMEVLSLKNNNLVAGSGYFNFQLVFESNMVSDGIILENKLQNKEYIVKLRGSENYSYMHLMPGSKIIMDFLSKNKDTLMTFIRDFNGPLAVTIGNCQYKFIANSNARYRELFCNDSLIATTNEMDDKIVMVVSNSITENQLADMLNLMFAYDYTQAVEDRVYSFYSSY
jgi:hypothetical protein